MIAKFLEYILVHPVSKTPLFYNKASNSFLGDTDDFNIVENVPNLLPSSSEVAVVTPLHILAQSIFSYAEHYQADAETTDYFKEDESKATREERRRSHEAVFSEVPTSAKLILDAGCGGAWVAAHFLKKGRQVVSMDISTINPTRALKAFPAEGHAAIVADVFALPFAQNTFDCIIASEIIEHIHTPGDFIDKLLETLKPGGKLILVTPYNEKIEYFLCVHCNKLTPRNAHLHSFNENSMAKLLGGKEVSWTNKMLCNKYMGKLRLYVLLSFMPYWMWRLVDKIANSFVYKPSVYLISVLKK